MVKLKSSLEEFYQCLIKERARRGKKGRNGVESKGGGKARELNLISPKAATPSSLGYYQPNFQSFDFLGGNCIAGCLVSSFKFSPKF